MAEGAASFISGLDDENNGETEGEEDLESTDEAQESLEAEEDFDDEIGESSDDYDEGDEDLKVVDEALSHRDLAIRRAIEERLEAKRLSQDLDYLDLDLDDED